MAPPRRRFAKPLTSRRYLALRHGRRKAQKLDALPELLPGYKQLFSFDRPGLLGGAYSITVRQSISRTPRDDNDKTAPDLSPTCTQDFEVLAPRFELPADAVYSVYPEQGHEAKHDTLPHVVFNDHMLPWERAGSDEAEDHRPGDYDSNRVPWLACLVFSPDELRLGDDESKAIFEKTSIKDTVQQADSMAVKVPIADLLNLAAKSPFDNIDQATKPDTNIIFPSAKLFNGLFAAYDSKNNQQASPFGGPDVSRHRFLAHMMRINTAGMAEADRSEHDITREFSIVLANRIGPLAGANPTRMLAHIVSLEGIERATALRPFPIPQPADARPPRVALLSLHSWSYTSLPPTAPTAAATFQHLATGMQMLRPPLPTTPNPDPVAARMRHRLEDGYTLVRSRTATGEETAALLRGPLTPNVVPPREGHLLAGSASGLQVLDRGLGVMDLTFAAAWALGRTLALADRAFTTALARVRHRVLKAAGDAARGEMVRATARGCYSRVELVRVLGGLVDEAVEVSRTRPEPRWVRPESAAPDLSYRAVAPFLEAAMLEAAYDEAGSLEEKPEGWTLSYAPPYDEFNEPASPDWMIVFRFVLDLYYLVNVPSHYLLTDQSQLPRESLRFFYIDHNWIDALVDGALSLGNQGGANADSPEGAPADDPVRRAIKKAVNRFFDEPACLERRPAIPRFGFYLRSQVVTQFPDLRVSVQPEKLTTPPDVGPMLLRHDILDKETMLGFFSEKPITNGLEGLRFEVPAHQQSFSAAQAVTPTEFTVSYKRQYTVQDPDDPQRNEPVARLSWQRNAQGGRSDGSKRDLRRRDPFFVWGLTAEAGDNDLRLLLVEKMADDLYTTVKDEMAQINANWFSEVCATSAMVAYQLSSPSWQLDIGNMPALAQAGAVRRISGRLSYRDAPSAGELRVQAVSAKIESRLPTLAERARLPGLARQAVPPYAHCLPLPPPPSASTTSSHTHPPPARPSTPPSSWELVGPSSPPLDANTDTDSDFEDLAPLAAPLRALRLVGLPKFTYHISTTTHPATRSIPILPSRQDLIFSIIYASDGRDFALERLTINIPVHATPPSKRHNLLQDQVAASGARARMVSNLRFNVRAGYSAAAGALELTLVPRSRAGRGGGVAMDAWVGAEVDVPGGGTRRTRLAERTELSVVLYGVRVVQYAADTDCEVWVTPKYAGSADPTREVVYAALKRVPVPDPKPPPRGGVGPAGGEE